MNSKTPVVSQIAWISLVPHLIVMGILMLIWYLFNPEDFIIYGALTYIIISQLLRRTIAKEHRKGMAEVTAKNYKVAIPHFKKSYEFFKNKNWIDKYRFLTLLSSGKMSYKEMALNNIAFCYSQMGEGEKAKEFYERTLTEYPNSSIAQSALNLINSIAPKE